MGRLPGRPQGTATGACWIDFLLNRFSYTMKLTLDKKILLGFSICSLVLLIVVVISYNNSEELVITNQWVTHTQEVLYELEQVLVYSVDAENSARGFIISGKDEFLQPFFNSKLSLSDHTNRIRQLTIDNPAQHTNGKELDSLTIVHIQHLEKFIALRKTDYDAAIAEFNTGKSRQIIQQIRNLVAKAKGIEQKLLDERKLTSETDTHNFNILFIVLLLVIAATLLVVYVLITTNLRALKRAEKEASSKNWNLEGSRNLIRSMQGNKPLSDLAELTINHLVTYLNVQAGVIYLTEREQRTLYPIATYAVDKSHPSIQMLRYGQGAAGQAANDKRSILLRDIPEDYFDVATGFGQLRPRNIIVAPFVFEDEVVGVIELGSIYDFTEIQQQYLQHVLDSIAIAAVSAQAREKTRLLLAETQTQAEELEAQQEELRQANEELHVKTELLSRSEAELKMQQQELQQINTELEEKSNLLEEQNEKLEDAKINLETKAREVETTSKYKSEFLANMSHELRTPLNSILILAQLLSENKTNRLGDKEIEYSKNIYNSGTDLLNLINEILDLSKIEAGKMQLEIESVPFRDITTHISSMFTELAHNKSVSFHIEYDEAGLPPAFTTDRQRVEQIIRNLLSNAFKFTYEGGRVQLKIYKPDAFIPFRKKDLHTIPNMVAFAVSDTGIGIPKNKRDIIFEAFQQADGSTKRKYGGTGLGLSISRELAYALGGEIHVVSEEGQGSTFTLYLPLHFDSSYSSSVDKKVEIKEKEPLKIEYKQPLVSAEIPAPAPIDDRNDIIESDRVILIIEDDEKFSKILLDFIHDRRYKGVIATQGNAAISYARHYKPDAILLDMKLPGMDGTEILKQLKSNPDLRHIPVQIISAYDQKKEGLELGAFDYIMKPVSTQDLQSSFEKIERFSNKKLKKLLIVEDNEQQNNAIRELISGSDVKCSSAYNGEEAFTMLHEGSFDCIIVDLGLPDMTGFELLEKIKSDSNINQIPIIVYTGRDLKKEESNLLSKLANTVVLKTADSHERLLDETILFLHRVESKLPKEKQRIIRNLHKSDEVLQNKKVLLVDDDMRNIYSLTNALESEGLEVLTAENGKVALDLVKEDKSIDLVLMDVMMPEMDGYEATQEIRKIESLKTLPIIALTAKAMKEDKEKCFAVGMSDYISKPVNLEQLLSLMRVWLYR
jgi:CheY-like chemotaxis protein/signal transduction histidine kinase/CHASE3 domain sensor protein